MAAHDSTTNGRKTVTHSPAFSILRMIKGIAIGAALFVGAGVLVASAFSYLGSAHRYDPYDPYAHMQRPAAPSDAQLYPLAHAERKAALAAQAKAATDEASPLELQSWNCDKERHYLYLRGEVKNVSTGRLEAVFAVGEFRTKDGELVKTDVAVLDYNPVMPGQTSSFTVMTSDNPMISKCEVRFEHVSGVELAARNVSGVEFVARRE